MRRYVLVVKATPEIEAGTFPDATFEAESAKYLSELESAEALVACARLLPSSHGKRVHFKAGNFTVTDGPFTETNEVIGGYAQFELKSKEVAVESAVRFMELHRKHWPGWEGETEVRQMFDSQDCAPKG